MRRRAAVLLPMAVMAEGGGPIQTRPASITAWAKLRILGEEAVAGMHGVASRSVGDLEQNVLPEVALATGRRAYQVGRVRQADVERLSVCFGIDRHGFKAGLMAAADHANRDLASVRNQDTLEGSRMHVAG